MKLYMYKYCKFVEGYKNAAIYDLKWNKVYSVNTYGKEIIKKFLNKDCEIKTLKEEEYLKKLLEMNLLSKKAYKEIEKRPKTSLKFAWLELTENCNLKCVHCYGDFGNIHIDERKSLSIQEWKNVIDNLAKLKCTAIQLIGGEPMIFKGFYEVLDYAYQKGMKRIDIFTNATLINEENIKVLEKYKENLYVRVSVYGHSAEVHNLITKDDKSFEQNEKALHLLKKHNINTSIAVVIMKENEKYINQIREYIESLGHKYNGYDVIRPTCVKNDNKHKISNTDLLRARYITDSKFVTNFKSYYANKYYNSCWNGNIAITSKGDIIPCIFARDNVVGNIKVNSIDEIKENIMKKWRITKDKIDVCKDCEYRYCCYDCRPLSESIEGGKLKKYPRCTYNPYKAKWEKIEKVTKEI